MPRSIIYIFLFLIVIQCASPQTAILGPVLTGGDNNCMFSLPFQIIRESWGEPARLRRNTTGLLAPGIFRDVFDYD